MNTATSMGDAITVIADAYEEDGHGDDAIAYLSFNLVRMLAKRDAFHNCLLDWDWFFDMDFQDQERALYEVSKEFEPYYFKKLTKVITTYPNLHPKKELENIPF